MAICVHRLATTLVNRSRGQGITCGQLKTRLTHVDRVGIRCVWPAIAWPYRAGVVVKGWVGGPHRRVIRSNSGWWVDDFGGNKSVVVSQLVEVHGGVCHAQKSGLRLLSWTSTLSTLFRPLSCIYTHSSRPTPASGGIGNRTRARVLPSVRTSNSLRHQTVAKYHRSTVSPGPWDGSVTWWSPPQCNSSVWDWQRPRTMIRRQTPT